MRDTPLLLQGALAGVAYPSTPRGARGGRGRVCPLEGLRRRRRGVIMNKRMNIPSGGPPEGVGSWGSDKERTKMHTPLEGLRRFRVFFMHKFYEKFSETHRWNPKLIKSHLDLILRRLSP